MSNYSKIKTFDIANGKGIRTSIFFSGCDFECKGCFNHELWDFNNGLQFTKDVYDKEIKPTITEHINGISILGGEPLHPKNIQSTMQLVEWFKSDFPEKTIWLWTGNILTALNFKNIDEASAQHDYMQKVITLCDVVVDGPYIEKQRDVNLVFHGSKNQRLIDVKETIKQNQIVTIQN